MQVLLNLLLLEKRLPASLRTARTIFVPKIANAMAPSDFRPITITSVILRVFHRILARRIISHLNFNSRQRAFLPMDGCAENITILQSALHEARHHLRPMYLASIDLKKAFDRVTWDAVTAGARAAGLSAAFVAYLEDVYSDAPTIASIGSSKRLLRPRAGVRQ